MSSETRNRLEATGTTSDKMMSFNTPKPEIRKDKQKTLEEQKAAAEVYEEFLESFVEPAKHGKLFVRGSVINAGSGEEKTTSHTGKFYKPPKLADMTVKSEEKPETPKEKAEKEKNRKKSEKEKKKSNLELFKEELRMIQEEREERHRLKAAIKEQVKPGRPEPVDNQIRLADDYRYPSYGSYDTGDPSTTNLYLGNLNPKMTEQQLCEVFGRFGPLASVKIMWPRSDEERARGRNCGFVAFMNRRDGERAMKNLNGKDIMSFEMKLGWGKAVPIPPHPVYIPASMMELNLPPPQSGLPFNAQLEKRDRLKMGWPEDRESKEEFDQLLASAVVKVVIPIERNLLCLIHRTIEFVVREGPMFEAMIMNRELSNPMFRFLFDNQSPAHVYYRWRLYSVLKGDHPNNWSIEEFQMFVGGSLWKPPPMNPFLQGMPEELVETQPLPKPVEPKKGSLSDTQRDKMEELIRNISPEKHKVADAMIYSIEHAEAADEIIDCLHEAIAAPEAPLHKKIARLYLVSDILHNCSVKIGNVSSYRKGFQAKLPEIFKDLGECFQGIEGRMRAEQFKQRVVSCFKAWEDWAIYPSEFLIKLQNTFLGLVSTNTEEGGDSSDDTMKMHEQDSDDIDGVPLQGDDIDGTPIDSAATDAHSDIDGEPISEDLDGQPMEETGPSPSFASKFKPSKWETVDPEVVQAQAFTSSKWDMLEHGEDNEISQRGGNTADDLDGQPMEESMSPAGLQQDEDDSGDSASGFEQSSEERRAKLRDAELKVMKYQDELESGRRNRKPHMKFGEQVQHYRQKLLKKILKGEKETSGREKLKRHKAHSISPHVPQLSHLIGSPSSEDRDDSDSNFSHQRKISPRSIALPISEVSHSPHRGARHHCSRSPKKNRRSRSRSPKRSRRSRSKSPHKRHLSPSVSPSRRHKSKKSKH